MKYVTVKKIRKKLGNIIIIKSVSHFNILEPSAPKRSAQFIFKGLQKTISTL